MANSITLTGITIDKLVFTIGADADSKRIDRLMAFDPIDPATTTTPHLVRPLIANAAGVICATVLVTEDCHAVRALVYKRSSFSHPAGPTPPDDAVLGSKSGLYWSWGVLGAPEIPGAFHTPSATYPLNALVVWKQITASGAFVYDGYHPFLGKTGGAGSCGTAGSGTGSGHKSLTPLPNVPPPPPPPMPKAG